MRPDPDYPRDLRGYGRDVPHARWPGDARIAVQFVLNYEEGGENSVLHGDRSSEQFLSEIIGAAAYEDRHLSMESIYEYGSRVGVWQILREFEPFGWPPTVFGVGMAFARYPEPVGPFLARDDEIANHGLRWIHYQSLPRAAALDRPRGGARAGLGVPPHRRRASLEGDAFVRCAAPATTTNPSPSR